MKDSYLSILNHTHHFQKIAKLTDSKAVSNPGNNIIHINHRQQSEGFHKEMQRLN